MATEFTPTLPTAGRLVSAQDVLPFIDPELKWCNAGQHAALRSEFSNNAAKKDGLQVRCKKCQKRYYDTHLLRIRERGKEWRAENKAEISRKRKEEYWADPEKARQSRRETYYKWIDDPAAKERKREAHKRDYRKHRDKRRQWYKQHYYNTLEKQRERGRLKARSEKGIATRRASDRRRYKTNPRTRARQLAKAHRRRVAKGAFSKEQWFAKCEYWGWRCYFCCVSLTVYTATVDHRIPISKGGSNWIANIAPACGFCNKSRGNKSRGNKSEVEYRVWRNVNCRQTLELPHAGRISEPVQ